MAERLPPGQQLAAPDKWPLVGEKAPRDVPPVWQLRLHGLVATERTWTLPELQALPAVDEVYDIHCVTRWSKLGVRFQGLPLAGLLKICPPLPDAKFLSFVARSPRDHSTSLPLAEVEPLRILLAWSVDGSPLDVPHGGPLRTVVSGRYFYKSLKWLERIEVLAEDRLGHWEAVAGYHNAADPWQEQRYLAANVDRREWLSILEQRDGSGRELLSFDAAGRDLAGFRAVGAKLRNADFRGANLTGACFSGANLTNAKFDRANLTRVDFRRADLEGVQFAGADLNEADFRGASFFGASFCRSGPPWVEPARLHLSTQLDRALLDMVMPPQAEFLRETLVALGLWTA